MVFFKCFKKGIVTIPYMDIYSLLYVYPATIWPKAISVPHDANT